MDKRNKMEKMPIKKLVFDMALPMMLSLLIQSLYNIVDSIFVSKISEDALTATSLAYPVQMLMIAFGVGSAVGLNAILSKSLGEKSTRSSQIATTGVLISAILGVLFMIAGLLFSEVLSDSFTNNRDISSMCNTYLWICMVFSIFNMVSMTYQRLM